MRSFTAHHPLLFAVLLTLVNVGVAVSVALALRSPAGEWSASLADALILVIAAILLTWFGWWRAAGFNAPAEWGKLHLLWYPLGITAISFAGGLRPIEAAALAGTLLTVVVGALQEEMIFRGIQWRALAPAGVMRAVVVTTLLFSSLHLLTVLWGASAEEAIVVVIGAFCAGFTYAALRYRTGTIWAPLGAHIAWNLAGDIVSPHMSEALFLVLNLGTLGLLAYGLFLLRDHWLPRRRSLVGGTRDER